MMTVKRGEFCPNCQRYYDRHVVVEGLVIKDRQVLLVMRDLEPDKGKWALPGGFINWDETGEAAVLREIGEETGAHGEVLGFFGAYSDPKSQDNDLQNIALVYLIALTDEQFVPQPGEVTKVQWFSLAALPDVIAFDHRQKIEEYKQKTYAIR